MFSVQALKEAEEIRRPIIILCQFNFKFILKDYLTNFEMDRQALYTVLFGIATLLGLTFFTYFLLLPFFSVKLRKFLVRVLNHRGIKWIFCLLLLTHLQWILV